MLFNSIEFLLIFLPICLAGHFLLRPIGNRSVSIWWLTICSFVFYAYWEIEYLFLLIASIVANFQLAKVIRSLEDEATNRKAPLLALGIVANLATIGYFKYAGFLGAVFLPEESAVRFDGILLPLAISFFTFQQIAYLVDAAKPTFQDRSFTEYALFVSFFPQLIAGPIVQHNDVVPQFRAPKFLRFDRALFGFGLSLLLLGLFKKVVLADTSALYATPVFSAADSGVQVQFFEAWSAALGYSFQLYFDFSGYSDMALGLAALFGIRLPINFNSPYKATSIIDFWRRWHITLSDFLKHYLYFPLGGDRKGKLRRHVNLLITMLLGGLWHGAGWNFIIWGGVHGCFLVVNHLWRQFSGSQLRRWKLGILLGWALTLVCVISAWVVFRAETLNGALEIYKGMLGLNGATLPSQVKILVPASLQGFVTFTGSSKLLAGGTVMGLFEMLFLFMIMGIAILSKNLYQLAPWSRTVLVLITGYFTVQAIGFGKAPSEFLYFQF